MIERAMSFCHNKYYIVICAKCTAVFTHDYIQKETMCLSLFIAALLPLMVAGQLPTFAMISPFRYLNSTNSGNEWIRGFPQRYGVLNVLNVSDSYNDYIWVVEYRGTRYVSATGTTYDTYSFRSFTRPAAFITSGIESVIMGRYPKTQPYDASLKNASSSDLTTNSTYVWIQANSTNQCNLLKPGGVNPTYYPNYNVFCLSNNASICMAVGTVSLDNVTSGPMIYGCGLNGDAYVNCTTFKLVDVSLMRLSPSSNSALYLRACSYAICLAPYDTTSNEIFRLVLQSSNYSSVSVAMQSYQYPSEYIGLSNGSTTLLGLIYYANVSTIGTFVITSSSVNYTTIFSIHAKALNANTSRTGPCSTNASWTDVTASSPISSATNSWYSTTLISNVTLGEPTPCYSLLDNTTCTNSPLQCVWCGTLCIYPYETCTVCTTLNDAEACGSASCAWCGYACFNYNTTCPPCTSHNNSAQICREASCKWCGGWCIDPGLYCFSCESLDDDYYMFYASNAATPTPECVNNVDCNDNDPCTTDICISSAYPLPKRCIQMTTLTHIDNASSPSNFCCRSVTTNNGEPLERSSTQITCLRSWSGNGRRSAWLCDSSKPGCYSTPVYHEYLCPQTCAEFAVCTGTSDGVCVYFEYCIAWQYQTNVGCLIVTNAVLQRGVDIGNPNNYYFFSIPDVAPSPGIPLPFPEEAIATTLEHACSAKEQGSLPARPLYYTSSTVLTGLMYRSDCGSLIENLCIRNEIQPSNTSSYNGFAGTCVPYEPNCVSNIECAYMNTACSVGQCIENRCISSLPSNLNCPTYELIPPQTCSYGPMVYVNPLNASECLCGFQSNDSCGPLEGSALCDDYGVLMCGVCLSDADCSSVGNCDLYGYNLCFCVAGRCSITQSCASDTDCLVLSNTCVIWTCDVTQLCIPHITDNCLPILSVEYNGCFCPSDCVQTEGCLYSYINRCPENSVVLDCNATTCEPSCVVCPQIGNTTLCSERNPYTPYCINTSFCGCLTSTDCPNGGCLSSSCVNYTCTTSSLNNSACPSQISQTSDGSLTCFFGASCPDGETCSYANITRCQDMVNAPVIVSCGDTGITSCRACNPSVSQQVGDFECVTFMPGYDQNYICDYVTHVCVHAPCVNDMSCIAPEVSCWRNDCIEEGSFDGPSYYAEECVSSYQGQAVSAITDFSNPESICVPCDMYNGSIVCQELAFAIANSLDGSKYCINASCNIAIYECELTVNVRTIAGCPDAACGGEMCHGSPCCQWPLGDVACDYGARINLTDPSCDNNLSTTCGPSCPDMSTVARAIAQFAVRSVAECSAAAEVVQASIAQNMLRAMRLSWIIINYTLSSICYVYPFDYTLFASPGAPNGLNITTLSRTMLGVMGVTSGCPCASVCDLSNTMQCVPETCASDRDCNDHLPCTVDVCDVNTRTCKHASASWYERSAADVGWTTSNGQTFKRRTIAGGRYALSYNRYNLSAIPENDIANGMWLFDRSLEGTVSCICEEMACMTSLAAVGGLSHGGVCTSGISQCNALITSDSASATWLSAMSSAECSFAPIACVPPYPEATDTCMNAHCDPDRDKCVYVFEPAGTPCWRRHGFYLIEPPSPLPIGADVCDGTGVCVHRETECNTLEEGILLNVASLVFTGVDYSCVGDISDPPERRRWKDGHAIFGRSDSTFFITNMHYVVTIPQSLKLWAVDDSTRELNVILNTGDASLSSSIITDDSVTIDEYGTINVDVSKYIFDLGGTTLGIGGRYPVDLRFSTLLISTNCTFTVEYGLTPGILLSNGYIQCPSSTMTRRDTRSQRVRSDVRLFDTRGRNFYQHVDFPLSATKRTVFESVHPWITLSGVPFDNTTTPYESRPDVDNQISSSTVESFGEWFALLSYNGQGISLSRPSPAPNTGNVIFNWGFYSNAFWPMDNRGNTYGNNTDADGHQRYFTVRFSGAFSKNCSAYITVCTFGDLILAVNDVIIFAIGESPTSEMYPVCKTAAYDSTSWSVSSKRQVARGELLGVEAIAECLNYTSTMTIYYAQRRQYPAQSYLSIDTSLDLLPCPLADSFCGICDLFWADWCPGYGNATIDNSVALTGIYNDTDGDGIIDMLDGCPFDPLKSGAGICGCNVSDADNNNNGIPDCLETCLWAWTSFPQLSSDIDKLINPTYYSWSSVYGTCSNISDCASVSNCMTRACISGLCVSVPEVCESESAVATALHQLNAAGDISCDQVCGSCVGIDVDATTSGYCTRDVSQSCVPSIAALLLGGPISSPPAFYDAEMLTSLPLITPNCTLCVRCLTASGVSSLIAQKVVCIEPGKTYNDACNTDTGCVNLPALCTFTCHNTEEEDVYCLGCGSRSLRSSNLNVMLASCIPIPPSEDAAGVSTWTGFENEGYNWSTTYGLSASENSWTFRCDCPLNMVPPTCLANINWMGDTCSGPNDAIDNGDIAIYMDTTGSYSDYSCTFVHSECLPGCGVTHSPCYTIKCDNTTVYNPGNAKCWIDTVKCLDGYVCDAQGDGTCVESQTYCVPCGVGLGVYNNNSCGWPSVQTSGEDAWPNVLTTCNDIYCYDGDPTHSFGCIRAQILADNGSVSYQPLCVYAKFTPVDPTQIVYWETGNPNRGELQNTIYPSIPCISDGTSGRCPSDKTRSRPDDVPNTFYMLGRTYVSGTVLVMSSRCPAAEEWGRKKRTLTNWTDVDYLLTYGACVPITFDHTACICTPLPDNVDTGPLDVKWNLSLISNAVADNAAVISLRMLSAISTTPYGRQIDVSDCLWQICRGLLAYGNGFVANNCFVAATDPISPLFTTYIRSALVSALVTRSTLIFNNYVNLWSTMQIYEQIYNTSLSISSGDYPEGMCTGVAAALIYGDGSVNAYPAAYRVASACAAAVDCQGYPCFAYPDAECIKSHGDSCNSAAVDCPFIAYCPLAVNETSDECDICDDGDPRTADVRLANESWRCVSRLSPASHATACPDGALADMLCDDGDGSTFDVCTDFGQTDVRCVHEQQCNDGNPCTIDIVDGRECRFVVDMTRPRCFEQRPYGICDATGRCVSQNPLFVMYESQSTFAMPTYGSAAFDTPLSIAVPTNDTLSVLQTSAGMETFYGSLVLPVPLHPNHAARSNCYFLLQMNGFQVNDYYTLASPLAIVCAAQVTGTLGSWFCSNFTSSEQSIWMPVTIPSDEPSNTSDVPIDSSIKRVLVRVQLVSTRSGQSYSSETVTLADGQGAIVCLGAEPSMCYVNQAGYFGSDDESAAFNTDLLDVNAIDFMNWNPVYSLQQIAFPGYVDRMACYYDASDDTCLCGLRSCAYERAVSDSLRAAVATALVGNEFDNGVIMRSHNIFGRAAYGSLSTCTSECSDCVDSSVMWACYHEFENHNAVNNGNGACASLAIGLRSLAPQCVPCLWCLEGRGHLYERSSLYGSAVAWLCNPWVNGTIATVYEQPNDSVVYDASGHIITELAYVPPWNTVEDGCTCSFASICSFQQYASFTVCSGNTSCVWNASIMQGSCSSNLQMLCINSTSSVQYDSYHACQKQNPCEHTVYEHPLCPCPEDGTVTSDYLMQAFGTSSPTTCSNLEIVVINSCGMLNGANSSVGYTLGCRTLSETDGTSIVQCQNTSTAYSTCEINSNVSTNGTYACITPYIDPITGNCLLETRPICNDGNPHTLDLCIPPYLATNTSGPCVHLPYTWQNSSLDSDWWQYPLEQCILRPDNPPTDCVNGYSASLRVYCVYRGTKRLHIVPPVVYNLVFTPTFGPVGTQVTITGADQTSKRVLNFTDTIAALFHGTSSTILSSSPTKLIVSIANGTQSGNVTVVTSNIGTVVSNKSYMVTTIGFTPTLGPIGTQVIIIGADFTTASLVAFNGVPANISSHTVNRLICTVQPGTTTGTISIVTDIGNFTSSVSFVIGVLEFTPTFGFVGTVVILTGMDFSRTIACTFNGMNASILLANAMQLTVVVPNGATTGIIVVTTTSGVVASTTVFVVNTLLFTPTFGPVGTLVTFSGRDFRTAVFCSFNNVNATIVSANETMLMAIVKTGTTTGQVVIGTSAGETFPATLPYNVTNITFTPSYGPVGSIVTFTGADFTSVTSVVFTGATATLGTHVSNSLVAITNAGTLNGTIVIHSAIGNFTTTSSFATTTLAFSPSSGTAYTAVTVTGADFSGTISSVTLNGLATSVTLHNATLLICTIGVGSSSGNIVVTSSRGTFTVGRFNYSAQYALVTLASGHFAGVNLENGSVTYASLGSNTASVSCSPTSNKAYIMDYGSNHLSAISLPSLTVGNSITVFDCYGVAYTPDGTHVLASNNEYNYNGNVYAIDPTSDSFTAQRSVNYQEWPHSVYATPNSLKAYIGTYSSSVQAWDLTTYNLGTIISLTGVHDVIVFDPTGTYGFTQNTYGVTVGKFNVLSDTVNATMNIGVYSYSIAITPDGTMLYLPCGTTIILMNPSTFTVNTTLTGYTGANDIAIDKWGKYAYLCVSTGIQQLLLFNNTNGNHITLSNGTPTRLSLYYVQT